MLTRLSAAALLLPLALTSGCLIETTLDSAGAGTVKARYKMAQDQNVDQQKKQFTSSTMSVTSASVDADNMVTVDAAFKDVNKITAAPIFRNVAMVITSDEKAGTKTLKAKQVNRNPAKLPEGVLKYFGNEFTFVLNVPGEITGGNATESKGGTATWKMPLTRIMGDKEIPFEVTWKPAAAAAPGAAASPAASPAAAPDKAAK